MTAGIIALPPNAQSFATNSSLGIDSEHQCPSWPSDPAGRRSCCDAALSSEQPLGMVASPSAGIWQALTHVAAGEVYPRPKPNTMQFSNQGVGRTAGSILHLFLGSPALHCSQVDAVSSRSTQSSLLRSRFQPSMGTIWPFQPLPVTQVPLGAVAGVPGAGEDAGAAVQAGLGLAGAVPQLTALARKQPGTDARVTCRGERVLSGDCWGGGGFAARWDLAAGSCSPEHGNAPSSAELPQSLGWWCHVECSGVLPCSTLQSLRCSSVAQLHSNASRADL